MKEGDLSSGLAESLHPFESNISPEGLDSAVTNLQLEGEKVTSPIQEKAHYASLSSSDAALLDSPLAPIAKCKIEDNTFSPATYPSDADVYPLLPSPQGSVPQQVTTPVPHGPILINGVYRCQLPTTYNHNHPFLHQ